MKDGIGSGLLPPARLHRDRYPRKLCDNRKKEYPATFDGTKRLPSEREDVGLGGGGGGG